MSITKRYASAIRTSNLKSEARTTASDADVLGAFAFASLRSPLAVALARLFAGDNRAARTIVDVLEQMIVSKAWHSARVRLARSEARSMSEATLAWHRDGVCKICNGLGQLIVRAGTDRAVLSDKDCPACRGTGKKSFERQFRPERRPLARWLIAEIEREQAIAGPAAMAALAPRLEIG